MNLQRHSTSERLRAVACVLLPAPLRWLLFRRDEGALEAHWYGQATGFTLLLQALLLAFVVTFGVLTALLFVPSFDRFHATMNWVGPYGMLVLAGLLVLLWLVAVVLAALGSQRRIPGLNALGRTGRRRGVAVVVASVGYVFAAVLTGVTLHSTSLTRVRDGRPARVYVLYDEHAVKVGTVPRWMMSLGAYRLARAARQRYGADNVVVDRMSPAALREAFLHGEIVVLNTHGRHGEVHYDQGRVFKASHMGTQVKRGPRLKLVYLTACGGGHAMKQWRRGLKPARVISFARNSATLEHAWWYWTRAPQLVGEL